MSVVKWLIILVVTLVIFATLYGMGLLTFWQKTPELRAAENEIECVAAAALADSKREPGANLEEVRKNIAKAVRRFSIVYKTPVCEVFERGLTMIPVGYKRKGLYLGRRLWFVKSEFTGTAWDSTVVMAKSVLQTPEALLGGCATHYIRADRSYHEAAEARDALLAMKRVPKEAGDRSAIEFFCGPKPA